MYKRLTKIQNGICHEDTEWYCHENQRSASYSKRPDFSEGIGRETNDHLADSQDLELQEKETMKTVGYTKAHNSFSVAELQDTGGDGRGK